MKIYSNVVLSGGLTYSNTIGTYSFSRNIQGKVSESVSVLDFGAKGNGTVDDSAAINRALRNIVFKGGGQLIFPPGTYSIASQLGTKWYGIGTQSISLDIVGIDATIVPLVPIYSYALYIGGDFSSVTVRDLVFKGDYILTAGLVIDGSGGTPADIPDHNADSIIVENCRVYNLRGLTQSRAEITGIKVSNSKSCMIRNCTVDGLDRWSWLTKRDHTMSWEDQTLPGYWMDVSGISAVDCDRLTLTDCIIKDVSHGNSRNMNPEDPTRPFPGKCIPGGTFSTFGTQPGGVGTSKYLRLYDANGIRVYNGRSVFNRNQYLRQQSIITNNTMIDCENRYLKLQTNGQAIVENNIFYLGQDPNKPAKPLCGWQWQDHPFFGATQGDDGIPYPGVRMGSLALLIDSQISNLKVMNNKFYIDDYFVGNKNALFDNYAADELGLTPSFYVDPIYSPLGHTYANDWAYGVQYSYNDNDFSPHVVLFQSPTVTNVVEPYESFYSQYENNEFYATKVWRNGIGIQPPRTGSTSSIYTTIKNNIHSSNALFSSSTLNSREDVAHKYFLRATVPYGPSAASGQWILDVSNNKLYTYEMTYFSLTGTYSSLDVNGNALTEAQQAQLPRDYYNNWSWLFYDNFRYPQAGNNEVIRSGYTVLPGETMPSTASAADMSPFTSNMLMRNNVIGDVEGQISFPFDMKKLVDGCDFAIGGSSTFFNRGSVGSPPVIDLRPKNMPNDDAYSYNVANLNSRIYKQGNFTYLDGPYRLYRSRNCITWDHMSYGHSAPTYSVGGVSTPISLTFSSDLVV